MQNYSIFNFKFLGKILKTCPHSLITDYDLYNRMEKYKHLFKPISISMSRYISIISCLCLCFCFGSLFAQVSTDRNYILIITPLIESTDANSLSSDQSLQTLQYFDGLGRPMQTVQRNITPGKKDMVSSIEYDGIGRQYKQWLPTPIADNQGAYVELSNVSGIANGTYADSRPFSEIKYESSPLNRVEKQYGAGNSWFISDKSTKMEYQSNIANDVSYYYVENNLLKRNAEYAANTLYINKVSDEEGNPTYEFKDKQGQVILKRSIANEQNIDTYYVYNDLGQLSYVLPPLAADNLGTNTITGYDDSNDWLIKYAYLYIYDDRGNNVMKRLPGCDYIYMVYDKADRLVLSQDGNQRIKNMWLVTKYDVLGRVIYTGYLTRNQTREELKAILDPLVITESYIGEDGFNTTGYSCGYFINEITPLSVNYYDNYSFTDLAINGGSLNWVTPPTGYDLQYNNAKGLLTGTRIYILDETINSYLTTALYYDNHIHVVQSRATNHLGGYDITYNNLDFRGKLLKTRKEHNIPGQPDVAEIYRYVYDNAERLITTRYKLGTSDTITLATNSYDELGRLTTKLRHNNTDTEQNEYNVRNWTTKIKSGAFEENMYYNSNSVGATPCYNGNISYSTWTYGSVNKGYSYSYDRLNRLLESRSKKGTSSQVDDSFDENFDYDKQGNILILNRWKDQEYIDQMTLTYNGNQLKSVYDDYGSQDLYDTKEYNNGANYNGGPDIEFYYDKNGNMTKDKDRNIVTIRYNILNLPDIVQFVNGNQIVNRYAANGRKLGAEYITKVTHIILPIEKDTVCNWNIGSGLITQNGTAYIDNKEYNTTDGNPYLNVLSRVHNPEGYVSYNTSPYTGFIYFRKDHLGNIREVWHAASNKTIQVTQYYPSGLPWATTPADNLSTQPYKYNGKEFVEMSGYNGLDYGARIYFVDRNGWGSVDPLAEMYYSVSPYVYCKGNPVNYIDPNGEFRTHFGAWLHKVFNGGGNDIQKNSNNQYYYTKGLKGEAGVAAVYGSNGVKGKPDQQNGASILGTASSQLMELGTSLYHEASIDMKEASNDAIDMWAKLLNNNSSVSINQNSQNSKPKVVNTELIDFGVVHDVQEDGSVTLESVSIRKKDGTIYRFNAKKNQFHKKDTFITTKKLKYSDGTYETIHNNFK